jgi:hypothetical protein
MRFLSGYTRYIRFIAIWSPILFTLGVILLGTITPGYDHFAYTISRLAIGPYGLWQQINFLQFGIGLSAFGYCMVHATDRANTRRIWITFTIVSVALVFAVVLFPTDPIENKRTIFDTFSISGRIHMAALALFLVLSPIGVFHLASSLKTDEKQRHLYIPTIISGSLVILLMTLWGLIFSADWFIPYRGLLQKIIALICIGYMEYCLITSVPHHTNH